MEHRYTNAEIWVNGERIVMEEVRESQQAGLSARALELLLEGLAEILDHGDYERARAIQAQLNQFEVSPLLHRRLGSALLNVRNAVAGLAAAHYQVAQLRRSLPAGDIPADLVRDRRRAFCADDLSADGVSIFHVVAGGQLGLVEVGPFIGGSRTPEAPTQTPAELARRAELEAAIAEKVAAALEGGRRITVIEVGQHEYGLLGRVSSHTVYGRGRPPLQLLVRLVDQPSALSLLGA